MLEITQQKIDIEAAFVRFIDNKCVVFTQFRIGLDFRQENSISHYFDVTGFPDTVLEADLEPDLFTERTVQLFCDTCRQTACRDSARLCVTDPATVCAAEFETDLRQLGGLAGALAAFQGDEDSRPASHSHSRCLGLRAGLGRRLHAPRSTRRERPKAARGHTRTFVRG